LSREAGREFFLKMAKYDELPVYKASYDLLLAIFQFTKEFGKEYKYTVGESLKKETIDLLTLIYRANSSQQKNEIIQKAREQIEVIRLFIRLMKDLKQFRLVGEWINSNFNLAHQNAPPIPSPALALGVSAFFSNLLILIWQQAPGNHVSTD
jgi:hypothetical protein